MVWMDNCIEFIGLLNETIIGGFFYWPCNNLVWYSSHHPFTIQDKCETNICNLIWVFFYDYNSTKCLIFSVDNQSSSILSVQFLLKLNCSLLTMHFYVLRMICFGEWNNNMWILSNFLEWAKVVANCGIYGTFALVGYKFGFFRPYTGLFYSTDLSFLNFFFFFNFVSI